MNWNFEIHSHYGNGYPNVVMYLLLNNYSPNRKKERDDEARAEAERIERELENTTLSPKFVKNVELQEFMQLHQNRWLMRCSQNVVQVVLQLVQLKLKVNDRLDSKTLLQAKLVQK